MPDSYRIEADGSMEFPTRSEIGEYFEDDAQRRKLFERLDATPNGRFFAARMTFLNKVSSHKGPHRIVLDPDGADMSSLVGKPIHFTQDFKHHFAADGPRTFGVTLGGKVHPSDMAGAVPVDVFGVLWDDDYPEEVEHVASNRDKMGMSWEIRGPVEDIRKFKLPGEEQESLYIKRYAYGGTAILERQSAAFPESHLLVAGSDGKQMKSIDLEGIEEEVPEFLVEKASRTSRKSTTTRNRPTRTASNTRTEETPMGEFCKDCKPLYRSKLHEGEIVLKAEIESQEAVAEIEAARDKAQAEAKEWQAKAEAAEKAAREEKETREKKDREVTAQTKAIEDWEKVGKTQFAAEVRETYQEHRKAIHLKESAEAVAAAYEALDALKSEKPFKAGVGDGDHKTPFDAFAPGTQEFQGVGTWDPPTEDQKKWSREYVQKAYNPRVLRALVHGKGGFKPMKSEDN